MLQKRERKKERQKKTNKPTYIHIYIYIPYRDYVFLCWLATNIDQHSHHTVTAAPP